MPENTSIDASSQWVCLSELVEAVAAAQVLSIVDAKKVLAGCTLQKLRPLLVERGGIIEIVSNAHDHTYDNVVRASLVLSHDEFNTEDIRAAAYSHLSFTVESVVRVVKNRGLVVSPKVLRRWEQWLAEDAPTLRAQGLLYEVPNPKIPERDISKTKHLTLDQAAEFMGIGRTLFDEKVRPHIKVIKLGHRTKRVAQDSLDEFITGQNRKQALRTKELKTEQKSWERKNKSQTPEVIRAKGLSGAATRGTSISVSADVEFEKALARLTEQLPKED